MEKAFKPTKLKCNTCNDVIFSSVPGEFVSCSCFKDGGNTGIYIDETIGYMRVGANGHADYTEVKEDD